MSLSVTRGIIADGAKELRRAWHQVRKDWDDENARKFEEHFLEPLAPTIKSAVDAIEELRAQLDRADRETSP